MTTAETLLDGGVIWASEFEDGMCQEREDVEGRQRIGQMLFAVPEVVLQVVALGFKNIVVPVLDNPAGSTTCSQLHGIFDVHVQIGYPTIVVGLQPLRVSHDQFNPVHAKRAVLSGQGHTLGEADGPCAFPSVGLPAHRDDGLKVTRFQKIEPLVCGLVGLPQAGKDEMYAVKQDFPAKRHMRVEIVAEQDDVCPAQPFRSTVYPTLGGVDLTVLFQCAVLRCDEFGAQWDGLPDIWRYEHGRYDLMAVNRPPVSVPRHEAVGT